MPVKIAVNGYGTIGKRIVDAVLSNKDFRLVGIAKYRVDYSAYLAARKGIPIYVPRERASEFREAGLEPHGYVDYLFEEADLIYDASPGGKGAGNKKIYESYGKPGVFQGGEEPGVAELSYSTLCNFEEALNKKYVRVVSCNTTGMLRLLCTLHREYGVKRALSVIIRRAADPKEDQRGPVNSILLDPPSIPSHHGLDARTVAPWLDIVTAAAVVPTTLMHMQFIEVELSTQVNRGDVVELLDGINRFLLVESASTGIDSTSKVMELARDSGRPRGDIYENIVFIDSLSINASRLYLFQGIHQESIVIPENIDVAYAMLGIESDPLKVMERVDSTLGIGGLRRFISPHGYIQIGGAP
ncbi:type II glyceraldehyde-3-phosphate dehydrogenase [Desulfurococcus mucosus]|uniref:Glyceraldehyde-3-phosphate dehydrogenase n=1 Tax=Desulfurococcus mucosus (strain ATCC 35584 / DSM 2162 / JCM 9187 / O7/1) TaxID=765177 RepID=E8R9H3_DESM0|nr:type II glyceraldehyde-3-phosphate dehydrogenase [Desulfurococcus mucosus]ADV65149.1 glyceraldehyde-3-phosphate dehydrogenase [Desulfurococcus mucosus DSM 2162]